MFLFLCQMLGGYFCIQDLGYFKEDKIFGLIISIFAGWLFVIVWALVKLTNAHKDPLSLEAIRNKNRSSTFNKAEHKANYVYCPYCNTKYAINEEGYYICEECHKNFRYEEGKVYKDEDTANELIKIIVETLAQVSKADGIVTQNEVDCVKRLLVEVFDLQNNQIAYCAKIFNQYKTNLHNKETIIRQIREIGIKDNSLEESSKNLIRDIFIGQAYVDGEMNIEQYKIISVILHELYIYIESYENIKQSFNSNNNSYNQKIKEYYKVLGLNEGANHEQIKKAYLQKVKIYHPDLFRSKNLPQEVIQDITQKFQLIQEAYEELSKISKM